MDKRKNVIVNLCILRTWCAVNPPYGRGLDVEDCEKAVGWLDDAIGMLKAEGERMKKSCGNCVNCEKHGKSWTCENWSGGVGWPCDCAPPHDTACENWSDDPKDKDRLKNALRYFVDHFFDNAD